MKICVLVKQVPGPDSPLLISDDKKWIQEEEIDYAMNESDSYALEEALQIKERLGEGEVVAASLGPDRVQKTIREALAKGADRGIHVKDDYPSTDSYVIAGQFALALKEENFDLILSGLQSDDTGMGQTGLMLGEFLGMSTSTLVMETDISNGKLRVKKELEAGWFQWVSMDLPACITIQSGLNTPRYPSLRGIMGAKKKEIKVMESTPQGELLQSLEKIYAPKKTKLTEMIEGDTDQVVAKLVDVLKRDIKVL